MAPKKCLFMPADFTGGLEYNYDGLKDEMMGYNRIVDQKVHIASLFLQNEWKNDRWSFLIGGRFDKHNLIAQPHRPCDIQSACQRPFQPD